MPELPEVESAVRRLRAAVVGRALTRVRTLHARTARVLPDAVAERLVGRRVVAVQRRGKHQWLVLDDGSALHAHFRMTGDWAVATADDALSPHARVVLDLDDGARVALVDPRALGSIEWWPADAGEPPALAALGPDALDPAFDAGVLREAFRTRRSAVKPLLLDQRIVAGIGNIYAAEALWRARIDPQSAAASLGRARLERLVEAIRATLHDALDTPGRYQDGAALERLAVYGREEAPCRRCGAPIRRLVQAGRSTYFCAACQRR